MAARGGTVEWGELALVEDGAPEMRREIGLSFFAAGPAG